MNSRSVAIVVGTRPEVIKMAPIYFALEASSKLKPIMISTGQHREMLDQALRAFGISPDVDLGLMQSGQTLPDLTSRVMTAVTTIFSRLKPAAVLLQGDTTTVLASGLAAFYQGIPIAHIEAGLRTHNMMSPFPEEMNRRLISPLSQWNFCPTDLSKINLLKEGIPENLCHLTGNTVIDSLLWVRAKVAGTAQSAEQVGIRLGLATEFIERFLAQPKAKWLLVTGHRRESFGGGLERICYAINQITSAFPDIGILYPVHLNPNVQEPVRRILGLNQRVALVRPASYEDFIWLMDRCTFVISDSGGVQEEAPSLGKPVLVLRETTERPEGIDAGTCRLVGTDPSLILREASILLTDLNEYKRRSSLKNPYGDGKSGARIVAQLENDL